MALLIEIIGTGTDLKTYKARSTNFTDYINVMKIMIPNSEDVTDRRKGKYSTDCLVSMVAQGKGGGSKTSLRSNGDPCAHHQLGERTQDQSKPSQRVM